MIIAATTKDISTVADATAYENMFYNNDNLLIEIATEPTFIYISRTLLALGGTLPALFFVYAIISIPTRMVATYKLTPFIFTALLIYIPVYFEVQDLVQIRAAAAAALLMTAIFALGKGQRLIAALLVLTASTFHYSSLIFIPYLIIGNHDIGRNIRKILACAIPICFVLFLLHIDLFAFIPSSSLSAKVDFYKETVGLGPQDYTLQPYIDPIFLSKVSVFYITLYYYDTLKQQCPHLPLLIWLSFGSLFLYLLLGTIPVLSERLSQLIGITDPILFVSLLYIVRPRSYARIGFICLCFIFLLYKQWANRYFEHWLFF